MNEISSAHLVAFLYSGTSSNKKLKKIKLDLN